jgi:hypothetical protein
MEMLDRGNFAACKRRLAIVVHGAAAGPSSQGSASIAHRTGTSKVGIPGAPVGMNKKIVTTAAALRHVGNACERQTRKVGERSCPVDLGRPFYFTLAVERRLCRALRSCLDGAPWSRATLKIL